MSKILTAYEIKSRVSYEPEGFVWLEEYGDNTYCSPAVIGPVRHGVTFADGSGFADEVQVISLSEGNAILHTFAANGYGSSWRCWSTRPTSEERKTSEWLSMVWGDEKE